MFPFFTIAMVILIIVFTIGSRKNTAKQEEAEEAFWKRELEANNTRKQDISKLNYITIPLDTFPMNLGTASEEELARLSTEKILNLTGLSNTDLKLTYGVANLEILSEYDSNFASLVRALNAYGHELVEAGRKEEAVTVLEYAVSIQADAREIYFLLADLYKEHQDTEAIRGLLTASEKLPKLAGDSVRAHLASYLEN